MNLRAVLLVGCAGAIVGCGAEEPRPAAAPVAAAAAAAGPSVAPAGAAKAIDRPDPDAPPGAPATWLPQEDWVLEHWLPYDHRRLLRKLRTTHRDLIAWVQDNERTLAELARSRGQNPTRLAAYLVRPWHHKVSASRYRLLRQRALKTLTQSHLSNHMFGHPFHVRSLQRATQSVYGVAPQELGMHRSEGHSLTEIGAMHGRTRAKLIADISGRLAATASTGVRRKQTSRAWTRFFLDYQRTRLPAYLDAHPRAAGPHGGGHGEP